MLPHSKEVLVVLRNALILNVLTSIAKIVYGFLTNTLSMIADGFHSLTDAASSVMGIISVRIASQPTDDDHHYGHHKFETLAAMGIGAFIGLTGYEVLKNGFRRLFHPQPPEFHLAGVGIILAGVGVNALLTIYERRAGKKYNSSILAADAFHTASDIWVSLSVFVSLICVKFGIYRVDAIVSVALGFYFFFVAYRLIKENVLVLSDAAFIRPEEIEALVLEVPKVMSCHQIRTRGRPGTAFVDLHVQIDATLDTATSHKIVHEIEDRIKAKIPGVQDVIIHTEPYPDPDPH